MTVEEVRDTLRVEAVSSQLVLPDGRRASVEEYSTPEGVVHVEYDGLESRNETRVALVWQPLPLTYDTVTSLEKRFGGPIAGRDSLVLGLEPGPAVWVEPMCDVVLTYYRRPEFWLSDVRTLLRVERLTRLPDESPASTAVLEWRASGAPPPAREAPVEAEAVANGATSPAAVAAPAPAATSGDSPPQREEYVHPVYPPRAKQSGVTGVVTLRVYVQKNGKVALARIVDAQPEGYGFDVAAVAAVERWKFTPARRQGRPVDAHVDVTVRFP